MNSTESVKIPNVFWKFFDLYRRKVISIEDFSLNSGITVYELHVFLDLVTRKP